MSYIQTFHSCFIWFSYQFSRTMCQTQAQKARPVEGQLLAREAMRVRPGGVGRPSGHQFAKKYCYELAFYCSNKTRLFIRSSLLTEFLQTMLLKFATPSTIFYSLSQKHPLMYSNQQISQSRSDRVQYLVNVFFFNATWKPKF